MLKERFDKVRKYVEDHKTEIVIGSVVTGLSLGVGLIIRNNMSKEMLTDDWLVEHPDEILVEGEWIPVRSEDGAYYSDAFADDEVKQDFIDMGFRIVDRE